MCEPVQCGKPDPIEHGTAEGQDWLYKDEISYSCDKGYKLNGVAKRTCSGHSTWKPDAPTCKPIECHDPERPLHGRVVGDSYLYQSVIEFNL